MPKTDWKAEAKDLKRKVRKLRAKLADAVGGLVEEVKEEASEALETVVAAVKPAKPVSPLAPRDGFPTLPVIRGVEFAAAEAGVKYKNRKDVMLVRLAPGTAIAGVFTKSTTRAACAHRAFIVSRL